MDITQIVSIHYSDNKCKIWRMNNDELHDWAFEEGWKAALKYIMTPQKKGGD